MLKIDDRTLDATAQVRLDTLHEKVNDKPAFAEKVTRAKSLWESKESSQIGTNAFQLIREALTKMSIGEGICNYCEQSEAGDIEHIWPKSFFPLKAFHWPNYLYACKQCNTGNKLDKIWIFDPDGGELAQKLVRGTAPRTQDLCFIDPRAEDPMRCMQLDLKDYWFYPKVVALNQVRTKLKVNTTLEILGLNKREGLVRNRRSAFGNFKRLLKEYVDAKQAQSHQELEAIIDGDPPVDLTADLEDERQRIMECTKKELLRQTHLTVFREMQQQIDTLKPHIQTLLRQSGALTW
jgi:hypothetical protein